MRPWMGRVIDLCQMAEVQARVNLGGADAGVAEQFLHRAHVAAGLQQMAGKRLLFQNIFKFR